MRIGSIGGGADEVMLAIISKYMGTLPEMKRQKKLWKGYKELKDTTVRDFLINTWHFLKMCIIINLVESFRDCWRC